MPEVIEAQDQYGKRVQTRIDPALNDELDDFCSVRGFRKQAVVATAIREFMLRVREGKSWSL